MNSQHFIWLSNYMWIAPHVLLLVIAAVMFRKGLLKDFPVFFTYLLYEFPTFCFLFWLRHWHFTFPVYRNFDLSFRVGSIALRFGIFREMFEAAVAHNLPLRRTTAQIMNWVTAVLVVLAAVFIGSLFYSFFGHTVPQDYTVVETLNVAQCGLLVLVFLWYRFLRLRMTAFVFGMALGIGLAAGLEPFILPLKSFLPAQLSKMIDLLHMAIYHCAVLIWLYFALARDKVTPSSYEPLPPGISEWTADLGRIAQL